MDLGTVMRFVLTTSPVFLLHETWVLEAILSCNAPMTAVIGLFLVSAVVSVTGVFISAHSSGDPYPSISAKFLLHILWRSSR